MKAMLLSAGVGQRLRPLTVYWAKPAMPLLGRPLIEYATELLRKAGIREVVVNLHHNPQSIVGALAVTGNDFSVHYSREPEILGTAGGLKQAEDLLAGGSFVLMNADTIVDVDLRALVSWHRKKKAKATLLLRPKPVGSDYTGLSVTEDGRLLSIGKTSWDSPALMFAGVWVLEPQVFEHLPRGRFGRLEIDLLPTLIAEGAAFGYVEETPWFDIGTPERYLHACGEVARTGVFRSLWRASVIEPPASSPPGTIVVAGPGTSIDPGARFSGVSVLGADCRVESGARIHRAVLWDRVLVGKNSLVRNSVLTSGVTLATASRTVGKMMLRLREDRTLIREREIVGDCVVAAIKS